MGWVDALRGKTVGLDTAPLIYFIEQSPGRIEKLRPFFAAAGREHFRLTTSVITLLEVLVHPLRNGREDLARAYRDILLRSPALRTIPCDQRAAEEAARLRVAHNLRTPDAIQVATAIQSGLRISSPTTPRSHEYRGFLCSCWMRCPKPEKLAL